MLIGAGKLAQEVLPFLVDGARSVDQWGRSPADRPASDAIVYRTFEALEEFAGSDAPAVLVVAAPAPATLLNRIAAAYRSLARVLDLRSDVGDDPIDVGAPVTTLHDLFGRMAAANRFAAAQVDAARVDILARSREYRLARRASAFRMG